MNSLRGASVALLLLVGCSSTHADLSARVQSVRAQDVTAPGRNAGSDADERALLQALEGGGELRPTRFGRLTVTGERVYSAASGRACRRLVIVEGQAPGVSRLACSDGREWFFAPDVFVVAERPEGRP